MDILFILKAVLLGIVEGLTEFLPISSTGHLIILGQILGMPDNEYMKMFDVVVQLGAILAVLVLFRKRISTQLKGLLRGRPTAWRFVWIWFLGCLPAAVAGFFFHDLIKKYLMNIPGVVAALIVGAILMLLLEKFLAPRAKYSELEEVTPLRSLAVGTAQVFSLWPGMSRSASTIMGGWAVGMKTALAAEFSFFLAIPIMFGASGYSLFKFVRSAPAGGEVGLATAFSATEIVALVLGFITAFAVAMLVVEAFMHFLRNHKLAVFAWYRCGLAAVLLLLMFTGVIR
ncbi:MAG: undecaprenyl-diphosphate phosphatase [Clostridiaceae bacterium]|nr:undecaprenyl-diphosphate phosphatase [Clostridiaceae bacterium]